MGGLQFHLSNRKRADCYHRSDETTRRSAVRRLQLGGVRIRIRCLGISQSHTRSALHGRRTDRKAAPEEAHVVFAMLIRNRRWPGASLRRTALVSFVALMLLAPSPGWSQALQSFEDLALWVNLDDQLQVEDQSGAKATGRLTRLTRNDMAIQTHAGEKRFTSDTVRGVAVRGHALRRGALAGAGVFAVLGAVAVCSHRGGGDCSIVGPLGAAPIGAGVGLAISQHSSLR